MNSKRNLGTRGRTLKQICFSNRFPRDAAPNIKGNSRNGKGGFAPAIGPGGALPSGFTLIELLVVIAIIAVLAAMLLPALSRAKAKAHGILFMNNTKQLMLANHMYTSDNREWFPGALHGGSAQTPVPDDRNGPWVVGWLEWGLSTHNTNIQYLIDPRYSKLAVYFSNNKNLFKCPADIYLSAPQRNRGWTERVRSVSGNIVVGAGNAEDGPMDSVFLHVRKTSELRLPGPADTWVYVDEHPDSINDAGLFSPYSTEWVDLPASYHNGACGFAFADGHSEIHKWTVASTRQPVKLVDLTRIPVRAGDPDVRWMRYRTPRKSDTF